MDTAIISEKGRKDFMEDAYYYEELEPEEPRIFGGVYDGHKGHKASEHAKESLHHYFFSAMSGKDVNISDAFVRAYKKTSKDLKNQFSGTTAVNFYIVGSSVYWANAGDSQLVVIKKDSSAHPLSDMHRVENPTERNRIIESDGVIVKSYTMKGGFGIEPTRAIGDHYFHDVGIISEPSTGEYNISSDDKWLVAGSDGLFDVMDLDEVAEFLFNYNDVNTAADALKNEVLDRRKAHDNTTFILILLG